MAGDFKLFEAVLKRLCPLESKNTFVLVLAKKLFLKKITNLMHTVLKAFENFKKSDRLVTVKVQKRKKTRPE